MKVRHQGPYTGREDIRLTGPCRSRQSCVGLGAASVTAQDTPTGLCSSKGCFGPAADKASLQLAHRCHLGNQEFPNWPDWYLRQVTEHHASFSGTLNHGQQEAGIAGKSIDLSYQKRGSPKLTSGKGLGEFWAVAARAGLHFHE